MPTIHVHLRKPQTPRVIDITPQPWWRSLGRKVLAVLTLVVLVPLLWFVGGVLALLILGAVFAGLIGLLSWGAVQRWRLARRYRREPPAPTPLRPNDIDQV